MFGFNRQGSVPIKGEVAKTFRPFVVVEARLPDPPRVEVPLPGEGSEAAFSWGDAASLTFVPPVNPFEDVNADNAGNRVGGKNSPAKKKHGDKAPPREQVPQDKKKGIITMAEIDAAWESFTVYQPGNNRNYVNIQRRKSARFRLTGGPKEFAGMIMKFNLKNPPPPKRPKDSDD